MFKNFFYKKKILITGHTGFKGCWLIVWLHLLGANLYGLSLKPNQKYNKFFFFLRSKVKNHFFDISNKKKTTNLIKRIQPDFIFHLAAQSLVSESYKNPFFNWKTNLFGTLNVLESIKYIKKKHTLIVVTSDKCYEVNDQKNKIFKETSRLGGKDPYSASKACVEILTKSFYHSFFKNNKNNLIATVRAGNVIGGGDFSEERIVPDCMKSWHLNKHVKIRNPSHVRPWQHVLDAISGYLLLAKKLNENSRINGESFNFGPSNTKLISVKKLVEKFSLVFKNFSIKEIRNNKKKFTETLILQLNSSKSKKILKWKSSLNISQTISMTSEWYKTYYNNNKNIKSLCLEQIKSFYEIAICKKNYWIK
jgi:CDP-glucose 4,6-dehydratase